MQKGVGIVSTHHRGRFGGLLRRSDPPALQRPSWDTGYSAYWEAPPESRWRRLIGRGRWRERLERYFYPPAALLVSLPAIVISVVVVGAPGLLLNWQLAAILMALWLASGVVVYIWQDTAALALTVYGFRRPSPEEGPKLESAWETVTGPANVDDSRYSLWVEKSKTVNAYAAAGRIVGVTDWALGALTPRQLEAVLAHELGHHLDVLPQMRLLARWYGLPITLLFRVVGLVLMAADNTVRTAAERRDRQVPMLFRPALIVAWAVGVLAAYVAIGVVLILIFGWLGTLILIVLLLAQPLAEAAVSRLGETRADRLSVELGYGEELCEVLGRWAAEPDTPSLPPVVGWLHTHPPTGRRIATIQARTAGRDLSLPESR